MDRLTQEMVAPLVGAWIEIYNICLSDHDGLVAPLVGAWIEIRVIADIDCKGMVAPLVGAWIEIENSNIFHELVCLSLLSWERGLKY